MAIKNLKIGSLLLDQNNPRIPVADSQRAALQEVLDDQEGKLANLADSIVDEGLSPTDNWLVMRSPTAQDKFVVLEGNRRLAALKILQNPSVLTGLRVSNALQRRFERAAAQFNANEVEPIRCVEMTRDEASPWIQRRHIGADEGRGIVDWDGQATARFRGSDPALQALEFVGQHGNLNEQQRSLLKGRFITTLRRLLETPDVRNELGLDLKKQTLFSLVPAEEVIKGLRRVVLDLAEKRYTVTQLKSKAQMVAYVAGLAKSDRPNLAKTISPTPIDELEPSSGTQPGGGPSSPGGPTGPGRPPPGGPIPPGGPTSPGGPRSLPSPPRVSVVAKPYRLRVANANSKAGEIYEELKSLLLTKHKHAISVLLRVFLELSVDHHLVSIGSKTTFVDPKSHRSVDKKLKAKVEESVNYFIAQGEPKREFDSILRALSNSASPMSPDLLHAYLHNRFATPVQGDLTAAWDNALPLFSRIWA